MLQSALRRQTALEKIVAELKRERTKAETDKYLASDPYAKQQQTSIHAGVAYELKSLLQPPTTGGPPNRVPPQPPPRTIPPTQPPQKTPDDKARDTMLADAKRRSGTLGTKVSVPYTASQLKDIRAKCETDEASDFGKVTVALTVRLQDSYDTAVQKLLEAEQLAQKYIKDHPDPKIGKLPTRVKARRDHCQQFLPKIKTMLDQLRTAENGAQAMVQTYGTLINKQQPIPAGVADEMYKILATARLGDGTKSELKRIADEIRGRPGTRLQPVGWPTECQRPRKGRDPLESRLLQRRRRWYV